MFNVALVPDYQVGLAVRIDCYLVVSVRAVRHLLSSKSIPIYFLSNVYR